MHSAATAALGLPTTLWLSGRSARDPGAYLTASRGPCPATGHCCRRFAARISAGASTSQRATAAVSSHARRLSHSRAARNHHHHTPNTYLYLTIGHGKAIRYGIGVGREGFTWSGTEHISRVKEWPDWFPPPEMIKRQPYLPRFMAGGETDPLGARAIISVARNIGSMAPTSHRLSARFVSSGCIRLTNEDVEDLFSRVTIQTSCVYCRERIRQHRNWCRGVEDDATAAADWRDFSRPIFHSAFRQQTQGRLERFSGRR